MNLLFVILNALIVWTHGFEQFVQYKWKELGFTFTTDADRYQTGPTNAMPFDVQPHFGTKTGLRIFVTVPKFTHGIPYTLATVHTTNNTSTVLLKPYSYYPQNSYKGKNSLALISVTRVAINECNQMWVLDSGIDVSDEYSPPKLLMFDVNTDQFIHRFILTKNLYASRASLFTNLIVDVRDPPPHGNCKRTMVYAVDSGYSGIVVYDYLNKKAWRIENIYMNPDPNQGILSVAGEHFISMDGIFGMATDKKYLYFHPLASQSEYAVPLNVLDNRGLFENNKRNMYEAFKPLGKRNACAASAMDCKNNLYCVTLDPIELIKWNVNTAYDGRNIEKLPIYSPDLEFVSSMKVVKNPSGKEDIWMLSNRYQKIAAGTKNINEVNFRIVIYKNISDCTFPSPSEFLLTETTFVFPN